MVSITQSQNTIPIKNANVKAQLINELVMQIKYSNFPSGGSIRLEITITHCMQSDSHMFGFQKTLHNCATIQTRRRSESAYIRQVNFLQPLCRVGEGDGSH